MGLVLKMRGVSFFRKAELEEVSGFSVTGGVGVWRREELVRL